MLGTGKGAEIGATVLIEKDDKVYFPLHDHNGNIISLINVDTLETEETYRYSAFGEEYLFNAHNEKIKDAISPWRFSSKRIDNETGFVNFGRRYYDPKTAVWLSPDPVGFEAGPNHYAYVMNSPLNHFDLYGLICRGGPGCTQKFELFSKIGSTIASYLSYAAERTVSFTKDVFGLHEKTPSSMSEAEKKQQKITDGLKFDFEALNRPGMPKVGIMFVNGICNSLSDASESRNIIASMIDPLIQVVLSRNRSHGPIRDVIECMKNLLFSAETRSVLALRKDVNEFFENAPEGAQLMLICHSQGALLTKLALRDTPYADRIHLVGIAPAGYTDYGTCASAEYFTSERDFVPLFDLVGRWFNRESITVLKPHKDAKLVDHTFSSPTYTEVIQENIIKFVRKAA